VYGHRYHVLENASGYNERGIASWYGRKFHGRKTSSGMTYNMYAKTAANKVLPLCTWVKVTNLKNGKTAVVQVNDRGPFVANRIIDLSYAAAQSIGMMRTGTALVSVRALAGPSATPPRDIERKSHEAPTPELHHHARLYLQLGAFTHRHNAEELRARLVLQQVGHVHLGTAIVHGKRFYRVQVGPYATVGEIDTLTARVEKLGYEDTEVVIK
jgi:rare lipoprotein A